MSLAAAVARTYFIAIEARMQIRVAQDIVDALTEIDRIVQVRFENGYANAQDAALARTDLENARDSLLSAQLGERDAIRALEVLLGQYPDTDLGDYPDGAFDYVVLSQTLQATHRPRIVLENLVRIGRKWNLTVNEVPVFADVDAPRLPHLGFGILSWGAGPEFESVKLSRLEPTR